MCVPWCSTSTTCGRFTFTHFTRESFMLRKSVGVCLALTLALAVPGVAPDAPKARSLPTDESMAIVGGTGKHCASSDTNQPCLNTPYLCSTATSCSDWYEETPVPGPWWYCVFWFWPRECNLGNFSACKIARSCKVGQMGMCVVDTASPSFTTVEGYSTCTGT